MDHAQTKTNIALIGMPSCGKSTVGVLLAKALNMAFVDTDLLIQQAHQKFLWQLIDEGGIEDFLRKEAAVVAALRCENTCIATGGSVVYSDEAMRALKRQALVVFIDLPCQEVERRIADIKSRGVVIESGKTLAQLYAERQPLYLKYADIVICAAGLSVEALLTRMVGRVIRDEK